MPLTIMLHLAAKRGYHLSAVSPFSLSSQANEGQNCHCEEPSKTATRQSPPYDPAVTFATIWSRFNRAMLLIEISLGQADSHSAWLVQ